MANGGVLKVLGYLEARLQSMTPTVTGNWSNTPSIVPTSSATTFLRPILGLQATIPVSATAVATVSTVLAATVATTIVSYLITLMTLRINRHIQRFCERLHFIPSLQVHYTLGCCCSPASAR